MATTPTRFFPRLGMGATMIGLLLISSPWIARAFGQSGPREIHGRVLDPTGAAVVGATVDVLESHNNLLRTATTNQEGRYRIQGLSAGLYTLRALSEEFEPVFAEVTIQDGIVIQDLSFTRARGTVTSIEVLGKAPGLLQETPGSAFLVSRQELEDSNPIDANEVLRRVPGVNLREDSGPVGMRLNIGIRGLNPDRSRQLLVLEDGIPLSLAPYGEPEMYYSPPIDRMRGVEVLKGSGQILYGPQTIGGVLNFVTPDPPPTTRGSLDLQGGQRGFFTGQASLGGSTRDQDAGWLLNYLRKQGDGFRNFFFDINDLQTKFTVNASENHRLGLKVGVYDERSNSTYLGLTMHQFLSDPNQNVVPHDRLKLRRLSGSLSHTAILIPSTVLSTTFFAYTTTRNWQRQEFDRTDMGKAYLSIQGDPSIPGGAVYLLDATGNRNREFGVLGLQSNLSHEHRVGGISNKLDAGLRYVYEEADDKHLDGESFNSPAGILGEDEDRFGKAFSLFAQDRMHLAGKIVFTPGLRLERYHYTRHIQRTRVRGMPTDVDRRNSDLVTKLIPGLGLNFNASPKLTLFTGIHRGFAPPRTKDAITSDGSPLDLDAELSWNYEAGLRFSPRRAVRGEITFFRMDFENQIIPGAQSGGATTTLVNGGETLHQGFETSLRVDWGEIASSPLMIYTDVRYTCLPTAKFTRNTPFQGHRLPYAPENSLSVLVGARHRQKFGFQIDGTYVADQYADNIQTVIPSADGTIGLLPGYMIWNLGFDYSVRRERVSITPYFSVKNLTNKVYISSRAPQGIQPGLFRQVNAGVKFTF